MQLSGEQSGLFELLSRLSTDHQRGAELGRAEYLAPGRLISDGAMRAGDLAHREGLDASTLSRRIYAMEEAGLLERDTDPHDRRAHIVRPTAEGGRRFELERNRRVRLVTDAIADWSGEDRGDLIRLVSRLNAALRDRSGR